MKIFHLKILVDNSIFLNLGKTCLLFMYLQFKLKVARSFTNRFPRWCQEIGKFPYCNEFFRFTFDFCEASKEEHADGESVTCRNAL